MKKFPVERGIGYLLIAAGIAALLIFFNRILGGDAFSQEEAQHALYGMWLWKDIRAFDLGAFFYDTSRQLVWPFLHSWILSLTFLLFGCSYASARFLSLLIFLATVALIYFFSREVCGKQGHKIGLIASALALTSPMMVNFASQNMLEGLGAMLFLAAAYVYTLAEEHRITLEYVILAVLIALMLYVNYLYAFLVIPAFFVGTMAKLWPVVAKALKLKHEHKLKEEYRLLHFFWWAYRKFIVLSAIIFLAGVWFSFSFARKVLLLYQAIFKYSGGVEIPNIWQGIFFYPKVIIEQLSFSPYLGLFMFVSIFIPFVARRYRWLNKLYVYVWTILLLLTLVIFAKAPQLIYIIIPLILIIFSAALYYFEEQLYHRDKKLAAGLLALIFLPALFSLPSLWNVYFPLRHKANMITVLDYFKQNIPADSSFAVQINTPRFNPEGVNFHFQDRRGKVLAEADYSYDELFQEAEYFIGIEIDGTSPYAVGINNDSPAAWNEYLRQQEMAGAILLDHSNRFEEIGVTAKIFRAVQTNR